MTTGSSLGAVLTADGVEFSVWSHHASQIELCLYDGNRQMERIAMSRGSDDIHSVFVPGLTSGATYGLRAHGPHGLPHRFDPCKLLADPYAKAFDRSWRWHPALAAPSAETEEFAAKCLVTDLPEPLERFHKDIEGGFIYELGVRGFTMLHPDIHPSQRGKLEALAEPTIVNYLIKLGVDVVELMPIAAWIDERHLTPLGLTNVWGYNPVTFQALEPRLAPGGIADLRRVTQALHQAGIAVVLDVVFNHSGESDQNGGTLSFRGLDNVSYYRLDKKFDLINDTGTGNTFSCDHPVMVRYLIDTMRYFVDIGGVDGFRFDLAPILGRNAHGFHSDAPFFTAVAADPVLRDCILIAEPWDIGPGGYQLSNFPREFYEWNDRARDDLRLFWRGDRAKIGSLATRLSGSSDLFGKRRTRSVNFLAAHDGFSLFDLVSYERKHNYANGEDNRDGHDENYSWNNGVEGASDSRIVNDARIRDVKALLASLFSSRGTIMITAGDEFGRTQNGNNNAYAQDNAVTWLNWQGRNTELEEFVAQLAEFRRNNPMLRSMNIEPETSDRAFKWFDEQAQPMSISQWEDPNRRYLAMKMEADGQAVLVLINGDQQARQVTLPLPDKGYWQIAKACQRAFYADGRSHSKGTIAARSVILFSGASGLP